MTPTGSPVPSAWEIWTADFPFSDGTGEKHRTVLILAIDPSTDELLAVKGTSQQTRTVYAGSFALYSSDQVFKKSGLQKDTKFDVNTLTRLPFDDRFTKKIGVLDVSDRGIAMRVVAAVKASEYYDLLRSFARGN